MPVKKITISEFIQQRDEYPVIDVRSPAEYIHAAVPGAYSLPLFSDEERAVVGTLYKQQGRQRAVREGLAYFGPKMLSLVDQAEEHLKEWKKNHPGQPAGEDGRTVIVHCWRGGMRSAGVAWLLDLYGFTVKTIVGGYKAYRKWALEQFESSYDINILGGYTGSAKTDLLIHMQRSGQTIINLEALANHRGSAFGAFGQPPQPSQEMFENLLAIELYGKRDKLIWLEDESQRIGSLTIPHPLWRTIRTRPVFFLDISFEDRLDYIERIYGGFEKERYINAVIRIQKRLGPLETKTTINHILEDNYREAFRILLKYYDKTYTKSLHNRENLDSLLRRISCESVNPDQILNKILSCAIQES